MTAPLDRRRLDGLPRTPLGSRRNWTKADVYQIEVDGRPVVVKDFRGRPWLVRHTLGRWFAAREAGLYRALDGVEGVPRLLGTPDPFSLALEKIQGVPLRGSASGLADAATFERLARILDRAHARGVAIGDLHHRNVLLVDGRPVLIDLGAGVERRSGRNPFRLVLYALLHRLDRVALLRMKRRFLGPLSPEEEREMGRRAWIHRAGRAGKRVLNAVRLGRHARKPP